MPSSDTTIHIAIELSTSLWLVAVRLPGSDKCRMHRVAGGDTAALLALLDDLRRRSRPGVSDVEMDRCFEAGRDGFWLHRLLTANGVQTWVVEPTSILVNRRARRTKTDRLDAIGLIRVLATYLDGDRQVCSMVQVPTPDEEDWRAPEPREGAPGSGTNQVREPHPGAPRDAGHPGPTVASNVGP